MACQLQRATCRPPIAVGHTWSVRANGHAVSSAAFDAAAGEPISLRLTTIALRPVAFEVVGFLPRMTMGRLIRT